MQKFEPIRRPLDKNLACLKFVGLWTDDDREFFETKLYWKYSVFVNVFIGGNFILGLIMYLYKNVRDIERVAGSVYLSIAFSIPLVKSVFFLKGWSRVKDLVRQLDQEEFQPRNDEEERVVFSNFRAHRVTNLIFTYSCAFVIPLWLISPLVVRSEEQRLPFPSWYPFDFRSPRYFAVAYLHQALGISYVVLAEWNMDFVIFGLMACLATECDILGSRLKNVLLDCAMEDELMDHMRHHWKILKFAEDANELLGTLNFVQFALSNLVTCMTMFQLSVLPPLSLQFFGVLQVQMTAFIQLLVYCYFGNNVLTKSVEISDALYAMPWIDGSRRFKKNILFFLMRAQRPVRILALNLFLLSLPTFTYIMRSSWSFFAMLHQMQLKRGTQSENMYLPK